MKIKFVLPLFILGLAIIVYGQSDFKNLKVLDPKIEESELKLLMKSYAKSLGVKCTFCHVRDSFHKDDKEHKLIARKMIAMTAGIRADLKKIFPKKDVSEKFNCAVCHAGSADPEWAEVHLIR